MLTSLLIIHLSLHPLHLLYEVSGPLLAAPVKIALPKPMDSADGATEKRVLLSITNDGYVLRYKQVLLSSADIEELIFQYRLLAKMQAEGLGVIVQADHKLPYERVADLLSALHKQRVPNIELRAVNTVP